MKLPVSNTNAPVWRDITVKSELPSQLKALDELAKNLWWVWNSEAKNLFRELDPDLWRATGQGQVHGKGSWLRCSRPTRGSWQVHQGP